MLSAEICSVPDVASIAVRKPRHDELVDAERRLRIREDQIREFLAARRAGGVPGRLVAAITALENPVPSV